MYQRSSIVSKPRNQSSKITIQSKIEDQQNFLDKSSLYFRVPLESKSNKDGKYLIANANSKIELFLQRFQIIQQVNKKILFGKRKKF